MFAFRESIGPVDLAFTDRLGGVSAAPFEELNLAIGTADPAVPENLERVREAFGPRDTWVHLRQVHGSHVHLADPSLLTPDPSLLTPDPSVLTPDPSLLTPDPSLLTPDPSHLTLDPSLLPEADGVVCTTPSLTLSVRAADCVPVLLADPRAGVIGAAHAGRAGVVLGVVGETVDAMRERGATDIEAWIGPYVCGSCYEVPLQMQSAFLESVPAASATTSWGTPALDLGAGLRAQLEHLEVTVHDVSRCTRDSPDLYSFRRDGASAGRHSGIIRMRGDR